MHCYDCFKEGTENTAVAVCVDCGAGVCTRHLHDEPEPVRRSSATGRVWSPHDARRMVCLVCHESLQQNPH
ncbi:DUF2180 family protein [Streptomyces reniochalinae]|uniref:DUF2180 family protein n=1 Tax=Streptomyces reniochalinae TaxID=2250578 RepID=A0A367EXM3_9ACTN|nr:DUF2180 family protein [Streptomyces reniochalinae]RCG22325.1 DUF2180 family protein [Streptomyces reniochalinae]